MRETIYRHSKSFLEASDFCERESVCKNLEISMDYGADLVETARENYIERMRALRGVFSPSNLQ